MGRIGLAFRMFFGILFSREVADRVAQPTATAEPVRIESTPVAVVQAAPVKPPQPTRSDAITLLEALQREARFLDFVQESLDAYDDAQVGAAVREIHRGSQAVLKRFFAIKPVLEVEEGSRYEVSADGEPGLYRLVGQVPESRPVTGTVTHSGWQAQKCELPQWTGRPVLERVIAPAEIEIG